MNSAAVSAYLSTLMAMDTTLLSARVPMGTAFHATRVAAFNSKEHLSYVA